MNATRLVATSVLALGLAAGAAFSALDRHAAEALRPTSPAGCGDQPVVAIPRVVVTAHRDTARFADSRVARIVVTSSRIAANPPAAAASL